MAPSATRRRVACWTWPKAQRVSATRRIPPSATKASRCATLLPVSRRRARDFSLQGAVMPEVSPLAGKPADASVLVNVSRLVTSYYTGRPDPSVAAQRVAFGTSGHRGSSLDNSFNEDHILAITQAICLYRQRQKIDGPLFIGIDTHALSEPAFATALEVLAANDVTVMLADQCVYTPTPALS